MPFDFTGRPGSSNPQAKLTENDVVEMLLLSRAGWPNNAIASKCHVTVQTACSITTRQKWAHVRLADRFLPEQLETELSKRREMFERWQWAEVG